jgi:esterase/lipase
MGIALTALAAIAADTEEGVVTVHAMGGAMGPGNAMYTAVGTQEAASAGTAMPARRMVIFGEAKIDDGPVGQLLEKWKKAKDSEREAVQKDLREAVKKEFQVRLSTHEKEIEQLDAQVKQLREKLDLRRSKQDEIVDFRVQQLVREAQGLGWGTEPKPSASGISTFRGLPGPPIPMGGRILDPQQK